MLKRWTINELHDDEVRARSVRDVVNGDDIGVIEPGGQFCLSDKAILDLLAIGRVRERIQPNALNRHVPVERRIQSFEDVAESSGSQP